MMFGVEYLEEQLGIESKLADSQANRSFFNIH